jgi:hypothetical protein
MSVSQASEQRNISEISATHKTGFLRTSDSLRCIDGSMFGPAMVASGLETLMCASRDRRSRVSIRSDSCHSIVTRDSLARLPLWNGVGVHAAISRSVESLRHSGRAAQSQRVAEPVDRCRAVARFAGIGSWVGGMNREAQRACTVDFPGVIARIGHQHVRPVEPAALIRHSGRTRFANSATTSRVRLGFALNSISAALNRAKSWLDAIWRISSLCR